MTMPLHELATATAKAERFRTKLDARHRRSQTASLVSDACSSLSIYLLKKDGTLWTFKHDGGCLSGGPCEVTPYRQVRDTQRQLPRDIFVCMCCMAQASRHDQLKHKQEHAHADKEH